MGSQPRTTPEGKAQADSKAQQPRQYVSISRGLQSACGGPSGVRRGHQTTSNRIGGIYPLITIYPTFSQRGYSQFSGELLACDYLTKTIKNPMIPQYGFKSPIYVLHDGLLLN
jgi:hypothetical protein